MRGPLYRECKATTVEFKLKLLPRNVFSSRSFPLGVQHEIYHPRQRFFTNGSGYKRSETGASLLEQNMDILIVMPCRGAQSSWRERKMGYLARIPFELFSISFLWDTVVVPYI